MGLGNIQSSLYLLHGTRSYDLERIDGRLLYRPRRHQTEYAISGYESDFSGQDPKGYPVTAQCPDGTSFILEYGPNVSWVKTRSGYEETQSHARTLEGGYGETRPNGNLNWNWHFEAE